MKSTGRRGFERACKQVLRALAPGLGLFGVLAAVAVYDLAFAPEAQFFSAFRLALIAKQTAIMGLGALGMTAVIVAGGIDLSAGAILALCSVVLAQALAHGLDARLALVLALAAGLAAGLLNGLFVTRLKLAAFIATLGTMLAFRGLTEELAGERKVVASAPAWIGTLLDPPARAWQLVAPGVWLLAGAGLFLHLLLTRTVFGRQLFAIGSNVATARLCGVPVVRRQLEVYALCGGFAALAGLLEFVNLNAQGNPSSGLGLELEMVAAAVLGGASLSGGRGSVGGTLIGALLMSTLRSACVFAQVPDPLQKILVGSLILAAVALDRLRLQREL